MACPSLGVDRAGRMSQLPGQASTPLRQIANPTTPVLDIQHVGSNWLVVGDSGTVAISNDGHNWRDCALPLSPAARRVCSFRTIASAENRIVIAGSPGSIVLLSQDGGSTWHVHRTEQTWAINSIRFLDRHRGWAVTDSARSWQRAMVASTGMYSEPRRSVWACNVSPRRIHASVGPRLSMRHGNPNKPHR